MTNAEKTVVNISSLSAPKGVVDYYNYNLLIVVCERINFNNKPDNRTISTKV